MAKGDRKIVVVINAPRTGVSILLREEGAAWDFFLGDIVTGLSGSSDLEERFAGTVAEYAVHKEACEYARKLLEVGFDYSTQKAGTVLWEKDVPNAPSAKSFQEMAREDRSDL